MLELVVKHAFSCNPMVYFYSSSKFICFPHIAQNEKNAPYTTQVFNKDQIISLRNFLTKVIEGKIDDDPVYFKEIPLTLLEE